MLAVRGIACVQGHLLGLSCNAQQQLLSYVAAWHLPQSESKCANKIATIVV